MYSTDLLPYVLPLDAVPYAKNPRERDAPKYDKETYAENVNNYKLYNMAICQLHLEDEIDDSLSPDDLLDPVILKLMYHPRFPDTFFALIANSVDGIPILQTENVDTYLELNYGKNIQRPDCEYLFLILTLWSNRYIVLNPANLNRALAWIEKKEQSLPIWPSNLVASVTDKAVESTDKKQPALRRGEQELLPRELEILIKALRGVGLLDGNIDKLTTGVRAGAVAGVIDFLYDEKYIITSRAAAFRTLNRVLGLATGKRTIQGYTRLSSISNAYKKKTLSYFKDSKGLH